MAEDRFCVNCISYQQIGSDEPVCVHPSTAQKDVNLVTGISYSYPLCAAVRYGKHGDSDGCGREGKLFRSILPWPLAHNF
jgi:hypothetical protein